MEEIDFSKFNIYEFGNSIHLEGIILSNNDESLIVQFPEKNNNFLNLKKLLMTLEDWQRFLKQTDILETEIFSQDPSGIVKKIVRKTQRQIDSYMQWAVFKRDNYTCRYCGRTGIPMTVDHIDLWEDGGATIPENLLSACRRCNKDRGRTPYKEWIHSKIYERFSKNLPPEIHEANVALIQELPKLQAMRAVHVRSR